MLATGNSKLLPVGGSVWAFDFSDWNNIQENHYEPLPADAVHGGSPFGRFLDLQGNLAIEGAFNEDSIHGGVYLHDISNINAPTELFRLPAQSTADSRFGISLAIDGQRMLVSDEANHVYLYGIVPEPLTVWLAVVASCSFSMTRVRRGRRTAC